MYRYGRDRLCAVVRRGPSTSEEGRLFYSRICLLLQRCSGVLAYSRGALPRAFHVHRQRPNFNSFSSRGQMRRGWFALSLPLVLSLLHFSFFSLAVLCCAVHVRTQTTQNKQVLADACAESGITPIEFHSLWQWTQQPVAHTFVSSSKT